MDTLSHPEIMAVIDQLIATFEQDDDKFYVVTEIAHQLQAELTRILSDEE